MARLKMSITVAALFAAAFAAGCGESSSDSADAPIKIAIIGGFTSPTPQELAPEAAEAAKARVATINENGGINGREVELIVCDDQVNVNKAGTCAREAVSAGAVALVGVLGFQTAQIYPIAERAGMASIGALPIGPAASNSPNAICFSGGATAEVAALPSILKEQGATKISALIPGGLGPATTGLVAAFKSGLERADAELGAIAEFPLTSSQFDAPVAKALTPGTDGVVAFSPGPTQGPLSLAVKQADGNVKIGMPAASVSPTVLKFLGANGDGMFVAGAGQPESSSAPGIKLFNADMKKHAPDAARGDLAIDAWASVWLFERLAKELETIDRASILKAVKSLENYDLGGIYGPLTTTKPFTDYPGMKCLANSTVVAEKISNGKFVPLGKGFVEAFG
jgi:branched-chain amino acid transport system substrate-binding protein